MLLVLLVGLFLSLEAVLVGFNILKDYSQSFSKTAFWKMIAEEGSTRERLGAILLLGGAPLIMVFATAIVFQIV